MGQGQTRAGVRTGGLAGSGLLLGLAKLWFLVAAYAITVGLTYLVPPAEFGRYYVVARIVAVPNLVLVYTLLFTVSRPLAAEYEEGFPSYHRLRRRGIRIALTFGGATSVLFLAAAPFIGELLRDPAIVAPLVVVAPISCIYALYAINLGTLNALRKFHLQASLDMFMATAKAGLILGAAAAGASLTITIGGFTGASVLALLLSVVLMVRARPDVPNDRTSEAGGDMVRFAGALVIFTACVNLLQSVDVVLLKRFVDADEVGYYASAQQVALVPLSLINAVSLLVFPLIATLSEQEDRARVRIYVLGTAKVTLLLLGLMASVGAAAAPEIQSLLFPSAYGGAADRLRWLVWGFSGYSFSITVAWIFNSTGQTRAALVMVLAPLMVAVGGTLVLAPRSGSAGASHAVAAAGALGLIFCLVGLRRGFSVSMPFAYLFKLAGAVVTVAFIGHFFPADGKIMTLVKLAGLTATYVIFSLGTGAVTVDEIKRLRRRA